MNTSKIQKLESANRLNLMTGIGIPQFPHIKTSLARSFVRSLNPCFATPHDADATSIDHEPLHIVNKQASVIARPARLPDLIYKTGSGCEYGPGNCGSSGRGCSSTATRAISGSANTTATPLNLKICHDPRIKGPIGDVSSRANDCTINSAGIYPRDTHRPTRHAASRASIHLSLGLEGPHPTQRQTPRLLRRTTAEYFLFTNQGAWLLYKTPQVTIPKKQARKFLDNFPSPDDVAAVIGAELKIPKCESGLLTDRFILYHAVHDSIIVSRVKKDTSLFRFCEDKAIRTVSGRGTTFGNVYLQYIRPEFENIVPHTCQELYNCGNNVIYCGTCTAYRTATGVVNNTIQCSVLRMLGRVTVPTNVARNLLAQCLELGTTKLDFNRAYPVLGQCFNMFTISATPAPPANMVINMLRDSLFVERPYQGKGDGRRQRLNWANFFNISDQPQNDNAPIPGSQATGNAAAGATVVGAGVAVGLGIASLLLG